MNNYITYNNKQYLIEVIKKNNKNTYIRVKDNKVVITTNYMISNRYINKLIKDNYSTIIKLIINSNKKKKDGFYIFGRKYDIIYCDTKDVYIDGNSIYTDNDKNLNIWLDNYIKEVFTNRLDYNYHLFKEDIPYPKIRIKLMKSRWGVCNTKTKVITLNKELIKYDMKCLDYVCIHELAHFKEGNHSRAFWSIVSKYVPNYKEIRKEMRG